MSIGARDGHSRNGNRAGKGDLGPSLLPPLRDLSSTQVGRQRFFVGSRTGDGQAQDLYRGHGCESLFLRSAKPLAARLERKHQWAITPILPEENRPVRLYPVGSGQSSVALKSTPEENLRLSDSCE
jgi:hypothetical protein